MPRFVCLAPVAFVVFSTVGVATTAIVFFFFSSRRRHTRYIGDWSSDLCSSDLVRHRRQRLDQGSVSALGIMHRLLGRYAFADVDQEAMAEPGPSILIADDRGLVPQPPHGAVQIGRASCRESV